MALPDEEILALYHSRDEEAIRATDQKYGARLLRLALSILSDRQESEESVSDTYFKAWNDIPPHCPQVFSAYLAKILRRGALDRLRRRGAQKRAPSEYALSLDELEECVSGADAPEDALNAAELAEAIGAYLRGIAPEARQMFVERYFSLYPLAEIAERHGVTESKVKSALHRARCGLRMYLEQAGWNV